MFVTCGLVIAKGSKAYDSYFDVEYCGTTYWLLNLA